MSSLLPSSDPAGTYARDLLRDTSVRWTVGAGPLAGTILDIQVHADGSVEWRIAAGAAQGRVGRARSLAHERDRVTPIAGALHALQPAATPLSRSAHTLPEFASTGARAWQLP